MLFRSERDSGVIVELTADGEQRDIGTVELVDHDGESGLLGLAAEPGDDSAIFAYFTTASDNAIAHSIASLVPEPMEKCADALASPRMTMFSCDQFSQKMRGKRRHIERLSISGWPASSSEKIASSLAFDPSSSNSWNPWPWKQASSISNTQVERSGSYW